MPNKENVLPENAVILFESEDPQENPDVPDFDLMQLINETESGIVATSQMATSNKEDNTKSVSKQMVKRQAPPMPVFNNCQISGNITINLNK